MNFNSWWYMGLAIISLGILIFIYSKKRKSSFLLLFLVMVEFAFLIETVIYIFGGSYEYFPKIIKYNSYYDSNVGALVSNLLIVPALATLIGVFKLNWLWISFFTAFLTFTEWLFLRLNIYEHNWWKTGYTTFGLLFVFFPLGKVICRQISKPLKGIKHSIFLFLCTAPILGCMHIIPIMWLSNRAYFLGWFKDYAHDTTAFASLYHVVVAIIFTILIKINWRHRGSKYLVMASITFVTTLILTKIGILKSYVWWDPWYYIFYHVIVLTMSGAISKRLFRGSSGRSI